MAAAAATTTQDAHGRSTSALTATERLAHRRSVAAAAVSGAPRLGADARLSHALGATASTGGSPAIAHASVVSQAVKATVEASKTAWRTMVREEVGNEVAKQVERLPDANGPLLKSIKKAVEEVLVAHATRSAPSERPWSEREKKVIRPEVESVFDSSFVRPIAAVAIAAMVMLLYELPEASGDVLTTFFPPVKKAVGDKSFSIKHFTAFIDSVFKRAMLVLKARQVAPDVIRDLPSTSTSKNKVTLAILAVLRVIVNDGRCQARAYWWRTIGYFIFHPSPLVYVNMAENDATRPALHEAEGSPYFEFKRAHLASPSGRVSVQQHVPKSIQLMTSEALAKTSGRAAMSTSAASLTGGSTSAPPNPSGGDPSSTTACQVPDEVQVSSVGCLFRVATAFLHALSGRDPYKFPATVVFAVAACLRKMVVEPRAHWTTDSGLAELGADGRNRPGRWYVLMPTMTKRAVEDVLLQTTEVVEDDVVDESAAAALAAAMEVLEQGQHPSQEHDDLLNDIPLDLPDQQDGTEGGEGAMDEA